MRTDSPPAPISLEHAFDYDAHLGPPVWFGPGPLGNRVFREVTGGRATGPLLNGELLPGGGDWALVGDDGYLRLDVRGQIRTDDGALVYVFYEGLLELTEGVNATNATDGETAFVDQYWRTAPRFETGDERYRGLTQSTFVARGRISPKGVAYEVFRVR
jgi:hypothetical protein